MNKLILLILINVICQSVFASTNTVISGVINEENKKPVPFANVILINATDSNVVKAALTDEEGKYKFEEIAMGKYLVMVAQMGYEKKYSETFEVNAGTSSLNVNEISLLSSAVNLKEAKVIAFRPLIEHKVDRTIVNVENSIVNAGATALEVLQRSPGITVDNQGNIILAGKPGVLVMIDGKPTYLSQRDLYELLRNMPSDQVAVIEIITNPSAKYDASGTSGIINIRLKKKQSTGFNGRTQVSYGQGVYPDFGTGINLNYGSEKLNTFLGYDYHNGYYFEETTLNKKFEETGYNSSFNQESFDKGQYINHTFRAGADYYLTRKQTFGILLKGNRFSNYDRTTATTNIYNNSTSSDSGYVTYNINDSKWANVSGNFNYRYQLDTLGGELTFDADYARYDNHNDFIFKTDHFFTGNDYTYTDYATDQQPAKIYINSYKFDYTQPWKKTMKIEAGAKTSYVTTDNDVMYYNYYSGIPVYDTEKSNHFKYTENINAAYLNWSGEFGKLGLQAGLRAEQTISEGDQVTNATTFKRDYLELFPSAFVKYKVSDKHQLNASYSRRIERPSYQQLNPFKYFIDPYNYMEGNPLLEPQISNSFELAYTFNDAYTIAFNVSHTSDAMTQITKQIDSTHTTFVTTENLDSYNNVGVNLSVPIKITEWMQSTNNFNLFHNKYQGYSSVGYVDKYLTSYTFNSTNSISLPGEISAEINFWYNSEMVWGTWLVSPQYSVSAGLSKMFLDNRMQLRINLNDIFHTEISKSKIEYQNINADFKRVFDSQFARIFLSYKFGKQIHKNRMHRTGSEDEQNRIQQGH